MGAACNFAADLIEMGSLTHKSILLADPRLVLEPNLDRLVLGQMPQMRTQRGLKVFLKAAIVSAFWPG